MADPLEVVIRPMLNPEEAHACCQMLVSSEPWITLPTSYDLCLKAQLDPTRESYVALVNETIAGFITVNLGGPLRGYIQVICVAPGHRNHGIGRKLIALAEERIFRESPNVFLCTSSFNTAAQRFYARLGYERVGEFKDYVVQGHSEFLLRKTLGPVRDFRPSG